MPLFSSAFARRTITLLFLGVLALLAIVAMAAWLSARTAEHTDEVIRERQLRMVTGNIQIGMLDAETGQRGYVLTGQDRYLEPYNKAIPAVHGALAALAKLYAEEGRPEARLDMLKKQIDAKFAELDETIALMKGGQRDQAMAVVLTERGKQAMDDIRGILNGLTDDAE